MNKIGFLVSFLFLFSCAFSADEDPFFVLKAKPLPPAQKYFLPNNIADFMGGPVELTWKTLTDVEFKDIYVKELDAYYWKPTFGASIKALEGKEVYVTGYVIPVDYDANFYVVSRYPYANCFFCGGGGPESVVDLRFTVKHRAYKTDERLTFKGKLKLNGDDVYQMNYILEGAVEFKP